MEQIVNCPNQKENCPFLVNNVAPAFEGAFPSSKVGIYYTDLKEFMASNMGTWHQKHGTVPGEYVCVLGKQGSLNYPCRGIKHCKCMVTFTDFPVFFRALFGLVSQNDLWKTRVANLAGG